MRDRITEANLQSAMNAKSPEVKHTPGPWKVKDIFQDNGPNIIGIFGPRSATSGCNGHCVAHVAHSRDAALVASAPDLYRIVHEQREVIADLHWTLEAYLSYELHGKRGGTRAFSKANAEKLTAILSAAAPFLD